MVVTCDYDYGSAAANVANSKNLIAFSTCAGDPKFGPAGIGPNAFTMATGSPGQAALMAEFAFKQGWKKAYILRDTSTAFEASFAETFKKRWTQLAGADNFLGKDTFGGDDPQIATQITRIKGLASPARLHRAVLLPAGRLERHAPDPRRRAEPAAAGLGGLGRRFLDRGHPRADRTLFRHLCLGLRHRSAAGDAGLHEEVHRQVRQAARSPRTPSPATASSRPGRKAVEKANSLDTDKVRAALETFKDEPLLAGPTTFTPDIHINYQRDMIVIEVKDGKPGTSMGVFRAQEVPQ